MKTLFTNDDRKLFAPNTEGGEGGSGTGTDVAPAGGNTSSSGPGEGRAARPAPAGNDIYGAGEAGEEEAAKGEQQQAGQGAEDFSGGEGTEGAQAGEGAEGAGAEGAAEGKATILKLDEETIAALRGPRQAQAGPQEEQISPAQIKQLLNPVEVTPEILAGIRDEDPAKATANLQNFANAIVKNAYSITKLMLERKEKQINAMLQPIMAQHEKMAVHQVRSEFYSKFGHLQKFDKIVKAAANEVSPTNANGSEKSKDQIFKEVAASTIATLKSLGVQVNSPNANPSAGAPNRGGVPQPNKFGAPGRSGGGNNGKVHENNPDADIYVR